VQLRPIGARLRTVIEGFKPLPQIGRFRPRHDEHREQEAVGLKA